MSSIIRQLTWFIRKGINKSAVCQNNTKSSLEISTVCYSPCFFFPIPMMTGQKGPNNSKKMFDCQAALLLDQLDEEWKDGVWGRNQVSQNLGVDAAGSSFSSTLIGAECSVACVSLLCAPVRLLRAASWVGACAQLSRCGNENCLRPAVSFHDFHHSSPSLACWSLWR